MPSPYDYLVVLDFEATCERGKPPYPQEIIEFPSVLLHMKDRRVVDEFEAFVRPQHNPQLTRFCTQLTGIEQEDVDGAEEFPEVFAKHQRWLQTHQLPLHKSEKGPTWRFVTCGDWDLKTMLPKQSRHARPPTDPMPDAYSNWINIKHPFARHVGRIKAPGMAGMLRALDLPLIGRHHRGIDDCRNLANIVKTLSAAGATIK